jgi:hypothetical protein
MSSQDIGIPIDEMIEAKTQIGLEIRKRRAVLNKSLLGGFSKKYLG